MWEKIVSILKVGWGKMGNVKEKEKSGQDLIQTVISHTRLPKKLIQKELHGILENAGASHKNLTIEQLRSAMLDYLKSIHTALLQEKISAPKQKKQVHPAS